MSFASSESQGARGFIDQFACSALGVSFLTSDLCPVKYVLITPAHNEERFITKTLDSMVAQTALPERWVIVDDGSTDRTAETVQGYAKRYPWIELVCRPQRLGRNFAGKAHAFNAGFERVRSLQFEVIGNLDADLSFEPRSQKSEVRGQRSVTLQERTVRRFNDLTL